MSKIPVFLILTFFAGAVSEESEFDAKSVRQAPLLREGFVPRRIDGTLFGPDSNDVWFFETSSDVNDYRAVVKAGARFELLPSSALESMIADTRTRLEATYRLRNARITKYKGRNFIFPDHFLPLGRIKKADTKTSEGSQQKSTESIKRPPAQKREVEPALDDANDVLKIPPEVLEKLRSGRKEMETGSRQIADSNRISTDKTLQPGEDGQLPEPVRYSRGVNSVFVDRTAFLVGQDDSRLVFVTDALGRNVRRKSLRLLPCEALELAELKRSTELERVRFKIAGIVTKYKGKDYLLLQKATQVYSYGNFGR